MKVRLGADAEPVSFTRRLPVAVTFAFGFRVPLSFIVPFLRVMLTVVVFVRGIAMVRALGLADLAPPANDHCRA
jgi:hypothetical protein